MSGFLLDTNVVSEFNRRGAPDADVRNWLAQAAPEAVYISVVTVQEVRFGVSLLEEGKRRLELERWIEVDVPQWFGEGERVLGVNEMIAHRWGRLRAERRSLGRPISILDALIAATAMEHDLVLVTRNVRDFEIQGLEVLNPWKG